jgi:hypothetical protein
VVARARVGLNVGVIVIVIVIFFVAVDRVEHRSEAL